MTIAMGIIDMPAICKVCGCDSLAQKPDHPWMKCDAIECDKCGSLFPRTDFYEGGLIQKEVYDAITNGLRLFGSGSMTDAYIQKQASKYVEIMMKRLNGVN